MLFHLRPHHLVCNLCFQGKGYSAKFVENFSAIHESLKDPRNAVKIVQGLDDICVKCPNWRVSHCQDEVIAGEIDRVYLKVLRLKYGNVMSIAQLTDLIKTRLTLPKFHMACAKCQWKKSKICENIIRRMKSKT